MTEKRISWEGGQRKYQPRIREVRIHGLYEMKVATGKPMTVILDEILAVAIGQFYTSPEYQAKLEADKAIPVVDLYGNCHRRYHVLLRRQKS